MTTPTTDAPPLLEAVGLIKDFPVRGGGNGRRRALLRAVDGVGGGVPHLEPWGVLSWLRSGVLGGECLRQLFMANGARRGHSCFGSGYGCEEAFVGSKPDWATEKCAVVGVVRVWGWGRSRGDERRRRR